MNHLETVVVIALKHSGDLRTLQYTNRVVINHTVFFATFPFNSLHY